jgi:maltose-binding protein MalE
MQEIGRVVPITNAAMTSKRRVDNMNWKKVVTITLATLTLAGMLAGCGGSSSDNAKNSAKPEKKEITVGVTPRRQR